MSFKSKHLLGLEEMSAEEIQLILDTADPMKDIIGRKIKKLPTLRGRSVVNLFYEPSTRTRTSFELAGKYLGADTINMAVSSSSVVKGESLIDTVQTLEVMGIDLIVVRHAAAGAPQLIAENVKAGVINAGDGMHEHPTQALLDMFTIRQHKEQLSGLKVVIMGDIMHSRVARSNIWGLIKMGAEVRLAGPKTLIPRGIEKTGAQIYSLPEEALEGADVVMVLRIQRERQKQALFPSLREYSRIYGLNKKRLGFAKKDALVMHPGPANLGVEIDADIAEGAQAVIREQVTNGVAVRMALLFLLLEGGEANEVSN